MQNNDCGKEFVLKPLDGRIFMIIDGKQKDDALNNCLGKHCVPLTGYGFIMIEENDEKSCRISTCDIVDEVIPYINYMIQEAINYVFKLKKVDILLNC